MRASYLMAHVEDVIRLRESLDRGAEWTREQALRRWGWKDRRFRHAVAELRDAGYPVISTSEEGSVYRKAHSRKEVEDFINRELRPRADALGKQIHAMQVEADHHFGPEQLRVAI